MSKKKSYMNINNILSEGILDTILRAFIPKDIQDKTNKAYIKIKEKELQKIKKQKKESDERLENILDDLEKQLEKRTDYLDSRENLNLKTILSVD